MAVCKFCLKVFTWGNTDEGRWVPLVPTEDHEGLDREYQDEHGVLRAGHRQVCVNRGGPAVRIAKLARSVKAEEIIGEAPRSPQGDGAWIDPTTGEISAS